MRLVSDVTCTMQSMHSTLLAVLCDAEIFQFGSNLARQRVLQKQLLDFHVVSHLKVLQPGYHASLFKVSPPSGQPRSTRERSFVAELAGGGCRPALNARLRSCLTGGRLPELLQKVCFDAVV